MTDDLATKLRTTGAFDSPWLKNQLETWDVSSEQKKNAREEATARDNMSEEAESTEGDTSDSESKSAVDSSSK